MSEDEDIQETPRNETIEAENKRHHTQKYIANQPWRS